MIILISLMDTELPQGHTAAQGWQPVRAVSKTYVISSPLTDHVGGSLPCKFCRPSPRSLWCSFSCCPASQGSGRPGWERVGTLVSRPRTPDPNAFLLHRVLGPVGLDTQKCQGRDVLPQGTHWHPEKHGACRPRAPCLGPHRCAQRQAALFSPEYDLSTPEPQLATAVQLQTSLHVCFLFRHLWVVLEFDAGHLQRL